MVFSFPPIVDLIAVQQTSLSMKVFLDNFVSKTLLFDDYVQGDS